MLKFGSRIFMSLILLAVTTVAFGDTVRRWDFTNWSEETKSNLLAVIASNTEWSDIEKVGVTEPTEASKENCFWQVGSGDASEGMTLTANDGIIKETEGLLFTHTATRALAIAINYPSTSLGTYQGPSYLWLGGKTQNNFVIPNVKPGATIKMGVESHKASEARGVKLYLDWGNTGTELKDPDGNAVEYPKTYTEQTWQVPASLATPCDVTVYNNAGCHIYYVEVTEPEGIQTEASVVWPFNNADAYDSYTVTPDGMFGLVSVDLGVLTLAGTGTGQAVNANGNKVTFLKLTSTTGASDVCKWQLKPAVGLTFIPSKISMYIQRFGTDAENGVTVSASLADGTSLTLGNYTAPRNNKAQVDDKFGGNSNYKNKVEITLSASQQLKLATTEILTLSATIGVGKTKQGGFSDVQIHGVMIGEKVELPKYTLATATNMDGAGVVSVSPLADEYEEGTMLTLEVTENFGYEFVNWTNVAGDEVSDKAKFNYTINADETLTANFNAVDTYELDVTVEGGAKDYMISYSPAPTLVEGKQMYEAGTEVEVTANSNGIMFFQQWGSDNVESSFVVTMDADKAYTATYKAANYIVGWDFYKAGNQNRLADFSSTSANDNMTFYLINEEGTKRGWLDKSTVSAGGYESFKGAAVNWTNNSPIGSYWFQFQVDASEFTNIRVEAEMMFNYNAYSTVLVQYSTDGVKWEKAGELTMSKSKTGYPVSAVLGADANNAETLYVRFYPDTNSEILGAESSCDGTAITNVFVYSDEQLVVTDGEDFAPEYDYYTSATYTRSIAAGAYGTICLPFAPDAASLEAYNFYELTASTVSGTDGEVTFTKVDAPEANKPYIYCLADKDATEAPAITGGATEVSTEAGTTIISDWQMVGSFKAETVDCTDKAIYALNGTTQKLMKVTQSLSVPAYRAYIEGTSSQLDLQMLTVRISGPTGIEQISAADVEGLLPATIYDLMGRPVQNPQKGHLYIQGGKKVVY